MIIEALLSFALAVSQETARARGFAQLYTAVRTPAKPNLSNEVDQAFENQGPAGPMPPTGFYHPRILWRPRFFWGFGGPSRLGGNVTGDYTRPIGRSREAPAMPPSTTPVYLILGDQAFRRGNVDRARKAYEQAVALDPDSPFTRLALAEVEFAQQEFDPAGQLVLDALRADPDALQNTIDRTVYYPKLSLFDDALAALAHHVHTNPTDAPATLLFAYILVTDGTDRPRATAALHAATKLLGANDPAIRALNP